MRNPCPPLDHILPHQEGEEGDVAAGPPHGLGERLGEEQGGGVHLLGLHGADLQLPMIELVDVAEFFENSELAEGAGVEEGAARSRRGLDGGIESMGWR